MNAPRRAAIVSACILCALAPSIAFAQEEAETDEDASSTGETQATDVPDPYEPDQRGAEGEEELERVESEPGVQPRVTADVAMSQSLAGSNVSTTGLGVDVSLWLGASLTSLDIAGEDNLVRPTQEGSFGTVFGFGFALRMGWLSIGPRVGFQWDPSFVLATVGIDATVRLTSDDLAPFIRASLSGVLMVGLQDSLPQQTEAGIGGVGAEIGGGVRWDVGYRLSIGAELAGGWHHLWRGSVPECDAECTDGTLDLRERGESDMLTLRLSLFAGWSF